MQNEGSRALQPFHSGLILGFVGRHDYDHGHEGTSLRFMGVCYTLLLWFSHGSALGFLQKQTKIVIIMERRYLPARSKHCCSQPVLHIREETQSWSSHDPFQPFSPQKATKKSPLKKTPLKKSPHPN